MIDDNAPTHERRKLAKTYKKSAPSKTDCGCYSMRGDLYEKKIDKME